MAAVLGYVAGAIVALWGVAHAVPTHQVVASFEPLTADNRRVVVQEWLAEAFTMWGVAALVIVVTAVSSADTGARNWVYRVAAALLLVASML
jgi:hypothetical protein